MLFYNKLRNPTVTFIIIGISNQINNWIHTMHKKIVEVINQNNADTLKTNYWKTSLNSNLDNNNYIIHYYEIILYASDVTKFYEDLYNTVSVNSTQTNINLWIWFTCTRIKIYDNLGHLKFGYSLTNYFMISNIMVVQFIKDIQIKHIYLWF